MFAHRESTELVTDLKHLAGGVMVLDAMEVFEAKCTSTRVSQLMAHASAPNGTVMSSSKAPIIDRTTILVIFFSNSGTDSTVKA